MEPIERGRRKSYRGTMVRYKPTTDTLITSGQSHLGKHLWTPRQQPTRLFLLFPISLALLELDLRQSLQRSTLLDKSYCYY
jgi:hypothetical protein